MIVKFRLKLMLSWFLYGTKIENLLVHNLGFFFAWWVTTAVIPQALG